MTTDIDVSPISQRAGVRHFEARAETTTDSASGAYNSLLTLAEIESAPDGKILRGQALVLRSDIATDRMGRSYLKLTLRCADGALVEARWWRYPYTEEQCPQAGNVYEVVGQGEIYNGEQQIRLTGVREAPHVDMAAFAASTRRSLAELCAELDALLESISPEVAALIRAVLSGDVYTRFCEWPAAQRRHGAVRHGLLAHSLRVAQLARSLPETYGPDGLICDRDLVIAGSLLHDIGKVRTLPAIAGSTVPEEAHSFDHSTLSVIMVQNAAQAVQPMFAPERLDHLLHVILAHHGRKEWGAAVEPQTVEAWLVHLADLAESRLWAYSNEE